MLLAEGLPYVAGEYPRILILGSFPGTRSLEMKQYYGNPHNRFWKIIERLYGIPEALPYTARIRAIGDAGIAMWDVIASCERTGAMDHRIGNAHVNDIPAMLRRYPSIRLIALNGRTAGDYFVKAWPGGFPGVSVRVLPSTSPANARTGFEEKVQAWSWITEG